MLYFFTSYLKTRLDIYTHIHHLTVITGWLTVLHFKGQIFIESYQLQLEEHFTPLNLQFSSDSGVYLQRQLWGGGCQIDRYWLSSIVCGDTSDAVFEESQLGQNTLALGFLVFLFDALLLYWNQHLVTICPSHCVDSQCRRVNLTA